MARRRRPWTVSHSETTANPQNPRDYPGARTQFQNVWPTAEPNLIYRNYEMFSLTSPGNSSINLRSKNRRFPTESL